MGISGHEPHGNGRRDHPGQMSVVVIGNGMVGLRFCERLVEYDTSRTYRITTFCEEPRAAYDRVGLTSFFAHRDAEKLMLARLEWYAENGIELHVGDRANRIDRESRVVHSDGGEAIPYDHLILATGSYPFVPPIIGVDLSGVFVYRTIEDLEHIIEYSKKATRAAVIGGGLLGLEAAKAVYDLQLETHVLEFAPRLMPRQLDDTGSKILVSRIEELGVHVHLGKATQAIVGTSKVEQVEFGDGTSIDVDMTIISAGIRPRDELAVECGLKTGERGGVEVDRKLATSDPHIFAIGEVALHDGTIYGLVAPGYEMADVVARNLCGLEGEFAGTDLSTKLKLMGVDVASFGVTESAEQETRELLYEDPIAGVYKRLFCNSDGTQLLGGILVGDTSEYGTLSVLARTGAPLPCPPGALISGPAGGGAAISGTEAMPADAQICSCNNVRKREVVAAINEHGCCSPDQIMSVTRAGTGCGGCMPLITDLFNAEMQRAGKRVVEHLCEHFTHSRTELFALIKMRELKSFDEVLEACGTGSGCEVCKPTIASILASLWNDSITDEDHWSLQDTNDRFLANIQRGGLYSVVPRVPGGEITPDKLLVIATVAKEYGLYTKITGGQRVDLFGARVQDLPDIWERLIDAGMESGHAYGKALRTVKSCVGTAWCRFGVQDAIGFATRVENRYKGIRAPHKIKMAVSGCARECAEAQSKDVGLVATEAGYNLYVCGNGGATPRHADLLVTDIDEETAIRYIDRFLMYYITTADKLNRTAAWSQKLERGLDHIRDVVVEDKLGIAGELEERMQRLVDTYGCEWARVVRNPALRARFQQFVNTAESSPDIDMVSEREQQRPADWPCGAEPLQQIQALDAKTSWVHVGTVRDFPADGGATVKYGQEQIAVFNFTSRGEWYATQQMCPHRQAFVMSRGIIGDREGEPKVACPLHKKTYSLRTGQCTSGGEYSLEVYPVRVEGEDVLLQLPATDVLDDTQMGSIENTPDGCDCVMPAVA